MNENKDEQIIEKPTLKDAYVKQVLLLTEDLARKFPNLEVSKNTEFLNLINVSSNNGKDIDIKDFIAIRNVANAFIPVEMNVGSISYWRGERDASGVHTIGVSFQIWLKETYKILNVCEHYYRGCDYCPAMGECTGEPNACERICSTCGEYFLKACFGKDEHGNYNEF